MPYNKLTVFFNTCNMLVISVDLTRAFEILSIEKKTTKKVNKFLIKKRISQLLRREKTQSTKLINFFFR